MSLSDDIKDLLRQVTDQALADGLDASDAVKAAVKKVASLTVNAIEDKRAEWLRELDGDTSGFSERNAQKWRRSLEALTLQNQSSIEAGQAFQREALRHPLYETDPLFGVLLRLHARGCRAHREIISLMRAGYADGAMARWRSLHEIAVYALIIARHDRSVAELYLKQGWMSAVEGMESYQDSASAMGRKPYSDEELEAARSLRASLVAEHGKEVLQGSNAWARAAIGSGKFRKLQEAAGLAKWWSDYQFASQEVHAGWRDMRSTLGMKGVKDDLLLVGPSDVGMEEPGHHAAIALNQVTGALLMCDVEDEDSPLDYSSSSVFMLILQHWEAEVGQALIEDGAVDVHRETS